MYRGFGFGSFKLLFRKTNFFMMPITSNSSGSYKLQSLVTVLYRYRLFTPNLSQPQQQHQLHHRDAWLSKFSYGYRSMHHGSRPMITATDSQISSTPATTDMVTKHENNNVQPSVPPPPSKPSFPTWVKWLLGSILTLVLPFWKQKWEKLLLLEGEVEAVVEEVEIVAEVVEKVATTAEKVSADMAEKLPDNEILKEAALFVEKVSTATAKDAELTKNFIHKVEELKDDLTDLETMVEPVIDKIIQSKGT
ncbi:uncharacterized protein LOC114282239 isoform X2 [Camellia sinensis]|uniref:uncharacterized protein LOC114282239 isoform X2 n=1 Tax=Camellia sinensis TaxID=4442 RepID=UPI0010355501|nr:uncharacterized protein LOC114282239 isoform X2 [Camellia sinensis]